MKRKDTSDTSPGSDLPPRAGRELSAKQRRLLELMLAERKERGAGHDGGGPRPTASIPPRDPSETPLLSFAQQRLWFIDQFQPGTAAYNIPSGVRLEGPLDAALFERSLLATAERHETMRTTYVLADGQPVQVIASEPRGALPRVDLRALPRRRAESEAQRVIDREARRPFALAEAPPWRALLVRLADEEHVFLAVMHHILSDTWTTGVFFREMVGHYKHLRDGEPLAVPPLPVQYADYALWQRRMLVGGPLETQIAYWQEKFAGAPPLLELPTDRPRPSVPTFRGGRVTLLLPDRLTDRLKRLSGDHEATLFMAFMTGFQALLHRYTQQDDILVGTPMANRNRGELEHLIGLFVNTLVLRTDLGGDPTFRQVLRRVRETTLEGLSHHDVPFEKVVEELDLERDTSYNPLFQAIFAFQNVPIPALVAEGLTLERYEFHETTARLDLELDLQEMPYGFVGWLGYNADVFDAASIARMATHFRLLLEDAAEHPDRRVRELCLLQGSERHQLLTAWNDTRSAYPADVALPELFERQAASRPHAVAVVFGDRHLSYAELGRRANRLAHHLRALGVRADEPVGLSLERAPEMVVATLGILKAGGAYVPLDPSYPEERLSLMIEDTGIRFLVGDPAPAGIMPSGTTVPVDGDAPYPDHGPGVELSPDQLAYVVYTSGSTGRPKGIGIPQRAVHRLVRGSDYVELAASDRVAQVSTTSFDAATFEIWGALLNGATLLISPREVALAAVDFAAFLEERAVTTLFLTTALFNQTAQHEPAAFRSLRHVLFGGEAVDVRWVRRVVEKGPPERLLHVYGPTENTTFSTWHRVTGVGAEAWTVPIGRPIANDRLYVLDRHLQPVPLGAPGELCLGGAGLARGYLDSPRLTARKFVPEDAGGAPGARLYRTGDLVRFRHDGEIVFLGRFDHQVKIRGFRIELEEIEAALSRCPAIADSVVVAREDAPGRRQLVAYVVAAAGAAGDAGELRQFLRARLPEYMLPAAFVFLAALPLNPNGKVDRRALPAPEAGRGQGEAGFAPPRDETEEHIAAAWRKALNAERVGRDDNFFEIGGNSLLLAQVHSELRQSVAPDLALIDLFKYPTIASLSELLSGDGGPSAVQTALEQATQRRRSARSEQETDVAIIGMALRFPEADDPEAYWRNLVDGVHSVRFFSREEALAAGVSPRVLDRPGYVLAEGSIDHVDTFDHEFFGFRDPAALETVDPQQRIFLENSWEALERAGYDPRSYGGTIGIYGGVSLSSYLFSNLYENDPMNVMSHFLTRIELLAGNQGDFMCTRISYLLDLKGPSVTVQSACSTSLVAVHLACQSLQRHECDMCLAGGVQIRVPQKMGYMYQEGGFPSPDGFCRSFDAAARGNVHGNGSGVVLLKRLRDAVADGDHVYAVVKGSAVVNDGGVKVGYNAPGVEGQARAVAEALTVSGVDPETIGYLEASGTATELGDPIEIDALTQAYRLFTQKKQYCPIGSVKSNIGHLDVASGAAGLIKTTLALERGKIPKSLHFERPNPAIDFAASPFFVNAELRDWPRGETPRRAAVHAYAVGGTNAHLILEQAPPPAPTTASRPWQMLALSARSASALERATANLRGFLEERDDVDLADVAYTLQVGRRAFAHRRFVLCRDRREALEHLRDLPPERVRSAFHQRQEPGGVAFLLPGDALPETAHADELYRGEPSFRQQIDRCAEILEGEGLDLASFFDTASAPGQWASPRRAPALIFAFEHALARLWMEWGVVPGALFGQGTGKLVAACLDGTLDLAEALGKAARESLGAEPAAAEDGLRQFVADSPWALLEVGAGDRMSAAARELGDGRPVFAALAAGGGLGAVPESATAQLTANLGRLWLAGAGVDWNGFYRHQRRRRVPLPTYPFERVRIWAEPKTDWRLAFQPPPDLETKQELDRWFYGPSWRRSEQPPEPASPDGRRWLVMADAGGPGDALAGRLREAGCEVAMVRPGGGFQRTGPAEHTIDPMREDDYRMLADDLGEAPGAVVHLWSLPGGDATASPIDGREPERGFWSLLHLGRALVERGADPVRFVALTQGVEEVTGDEELIPGRATILAPLLVLPRELPQISCRHVDVVLPPSGSAREQRLLDELAREVRRETAEPRVAYRGCRRWVQTYEPLDLAGPREGGLQPEGVYLITGGTERLGLLAADYLARTVRARLALVGESGLPAPEEWDHWLAAHDGSDEICRKILRLRELEELGSEIFLVAADVAADGPMAAALERVRQRFGAIHGVIHAGGHERAPELSRGVAAVDPDFYQYRLRSRVAAVTRAAELLAGDEVDFHLLSSTLGSVVGGPLAVVDGAADAFLDAFARYRSRLDRARWTSVNWDLVALGDEAAAPTAMTAGEGTRVLGRILAAGDVAQIVVSAVDLPARLEQARRPSAEPSEEADEVKPRPDLETPFEAPRNEVEEEMSALWAGVLGLRELGVHDNFFDLGGNSLMATQLVSRIRERFRIDLALKVFFEEATVARMAEHVEVGRWAREAQAEAVGAVMVAAEEEEVGEI